MASEPVRPTDEEIMNLTMKFMSKPYQPSPVGRYTSDSLAHKNDMTSEAWRVLLCPTVQVCSVTPGEKPEADVPSSIRLIAMIAMVAPDEFQAKLNSTLLEAAVNILRLLPYPNEAKLDAVTDVLVRGTHINAERFNEVCDRHANR